jgi:YHS domain-containing protein
MKIRPMIAGLTAMTVLFAVALVAEAADVSNAKCPISGKPAKEEAAVDFAGGKVYLCCKNCPKAFEANPAKFAAKAHHQMVVTGQAKQENCPFSGKPIKADQSTDVDGVKVAFCCPNCKAKVEKADAAKQIEMCFGEAAFKKAYKVGE